MDQWLQFHPQSQLWCNHPGGPCQVQDGHLSSPHSPSCHHRGTADSPHLRCLTALSPSPRHACLTPTSPLSHQERPNISPRCFLKLPWVTGPRAQIMLALLRGGGRGGRERTGMSKKHRNSICTVFLRGCFSSPRQPSLISCFQTAGLRSSRCGWRPWQLILTIFPSCTTGKREGE